MNDPQDRSPDRVTVENLNAMEDDRAPTGTRALAVALLAMVLRRKRPLDDALQEMGTPDKPLGQLSRRDRGFVRVLASTVLRRLGQIDALIDHCLDRPLPPSASEIHDVLRLGVAELLFIGTPPHAAVDEAVRLAELEGHTRLKALVNAVLRRLATEGRTLVQGQDAVRYNTPAWLWDSWTAAYGETVARAIAEANAEEAPLDISVLGDPGEWAQALEGTVLPTGTVRRAAGGSVEELTGFSDGAWWIQDAAAALPALLFGNLQARTVIDLCAAPGGKTAQLVAQGARVIAVDRSAPRLRRLEQNMQRLGLAAETVAADAALWRPQHRADAVLLDAPCTATGTIRRHPDVPWLKKPDDVSRLIRVQDRLLAAAIDMLKPGGTLVYCTCSLQPEEGPERIDALLASGAPVEPDPIRAHEIGGFEESIAGGGFLRTLPNQWQAYGGVDGFFAARLRRL